MHLFIEQDKANMPLWLGVGPAGIIQCPYDNRNDCSVVRHGLLVVIATT